MFDPQLFQANQAALPFAELEPLDGRYVAWAFDGHRVLVVADSWDHLYAEIGRRGLTEYVPACVDLSPVQFGSAGLYPDQPATRAG